MSLVAISLARIGTIVGIVVGGLAILGVILGPYRNRPRLRLDVHRDYGLDVGSVSFTVHVYNDGRSTVNDIRMVSRVGGEVVGERPGLVHVRSGDPPADARIPIPEPEYVVRRPDGTLDFPRGGPEFCASYRYLGWRWKKCEPWPWPSAPSRTPAASLLAGSGRSSRSGGSSDNSRR
jgi:hypothetical protein